MTEGAAGGFSERGIIMDALLKLDGIDKCYEAGAFVLRNLDLQVERGERVAVVGASGCGKSTLLNILGTLDRPDAGSVAFEDTDLLRMDEKRLASFRNDRIGFVFQLHHLLPQCTVLENVLVPSLVNSRSRSDRAVHLLERVGLSDRMSHRPGQLSGGERQRAAVVRALINQPTLLLADEPTGALNRTGADELMDLLLELNREENLTLFMVTHSMRQAERMDRILELRAGRLESLN